MLVPLLPTPQGLGVLLTVRSNRLRHHRGQIAFPGGRLDPDDASATEGALREAAEEIGLARHQVQVLGSLPGMATGTGYWVNPVVGLLDAAVQPQSLVLSPQEVQEAFVVPLAFLMNPANHQRRLGRWQQDGQIIQRAFHAMPWQAPAGHTYSSGEPPPPCCAISITSWRRDGNGGARGSRSAWRPRCPCW